MSKRFLFREAFIVTSIIVIVIFLLSLLPVKLEMVNPVEQQVADFDIYDLYYSSHQEKNLSRDSNIVLIQVGDTRSEIADQLKRISTLEPAVIALNVTFEPREDSGNVQLLSALAQMPKTICSFRVLHSDSLHRFYAMASQISQQRLIQNSGYINFIGQEHSVVRYYSPFMEVDGRLCRSFTSRIAEQFSPAAFKALKERNKEMEIIHFGSNINNYDHFTRQDLIDQYDQLKNIVKGKIVLLGFFSGKPLVLDNLKFSPLNEVIAGRSNPDMYGVVMQANILSMVLSGNYATLMPNWFSYVMAFCITLLFIWYIMSRYNKKQHPAHWIFVLIQLAGIVLLVYLFLLIYEWFRVKVHLLPIVASLLLALELLGMYRSLATWLRKKYKYRTIFIPS